MARKSKLVGGSEPPDLTPKGIQDAITRLKTRAAELEAFDTLSMTDGYPPELQALEASIRRSLEKAFGIGTPDFMRFSSIANIGYNAPLFIGGGPPTPLSKYIDEATSNKAEALVMLRQAISSLEEDLADLQPSESDPAIPGRSNSTSLNIFIVHGHDDGPREAVARFLTKLGFRPIILHEQANQGRTVIEKFEAHSDVGFAIALLTPDDVGRSVRDNELKTRARQNVILELGYFVGRLGRSKVFALRKGDTEIPSDYVGVVYQDFDSAGAWQRALATELQAAGYDIDWNAVMRG
ncbi:MAG: nucleotide-binding protein [Hyphomonadaceae bacterium]